MKYPFFIIIIKIDNKWWYYEADDSLKYVSKTVFYLGKTCDSSITEARIVKLENFDQLERLKKIVNNLPTSL